MEIIRKQNKYYLQFDNGELELSEQQVQKRIERGDKVSGKLQSLKASLPDIESNIEIATAQKNAPEKQLSKEFTSAKYFDRVVTEFREIYKSNEDKEDTLLKLKNFCQNSIRKLEHDRKSPRTDHVVIDYYLLSWHRVLVLLDDRESVIRKETDEDVRENDPENISVSQSTNLASKENVPPEPDHTKQLIITQLMQADGLFPINNALDGVTQTDIQKLIAGITGVKEDIAKQALHNASSILLKRNITKENIDERIRLLEEVELFFEELPYADIISRVKVLLKLYRDKKSAII